MVTIRQEGSPNPLSNLPSNTWCFFRDGSQWCCVRPNFINLQESIAGFGASMESAMLDLSNNEVQDYKFDPQIPITPPTVSSPEKVDKGFFNYCPICRSYLDCACPVKEESDV